METPEKMSENARAMRSMAPKQKTQKFMADFLRETQESFIEVPFCPVDSLVLSSLVYLNLDEYRYGNVHGAEACPSSTFFASRRCEACSRAAGSKTPKSCPTFCARLHAAVAMPI